MGKLVIATAEELKAQTPLERQAARRAAREKPLARLILRTFLDQGGAIPIEDIVRALPQAAPEETRGALATLEEEDLIRIRAGQIDVAYPFSAAPTPYLVKFPGGRDRYACCATDALGMASMAGEAIEIASHCHHCGDALTFSVMVWFGKRDDDQCKAIDGL